MPSNPRPYPFTWCVGVLLLLVMVLCGGCPRVPKPPTQSAIGGLLVYEYAGMTVMHQYSAREYLHVRIHFGWQRPEESSRAAQLLAVEGAFLAGAGKYSPEECAGRWEVAGATLDVVSTPDGPVVQINCLPERLDMTWEMLKLCLSDPAFDKVAFQALRAARVAAQEALEADRAHQAMVAAWGQAWPDVEMESAMEGSAAALEGVARTTAAETFRDLMRQRCNLRLVTVGPLDAERISDLLLNTVDALPDGECESQDAPAAAPQLRQVRLVHAPRGLEAVAGIFPGPPPGSIETFPMLLAMHILDHRLHSRLVGRDQVATRAVARYIAGHAGYNLIEVAGPNAFQCAEFILSELRSIKANGFTDAEVEMAKRALVAHIALGYESAPGLAARLDAAAEQGMTATTGHEQWLLETATAKTVNALLRQYLTGISWGIVGDTAGIDRKSLQRL